MIQKAPFPTLTHAHTTAGWWILGVPDEPPCGPYETRAEAQSDRRGMSKFFRLADRPGYVTVDRQPPQAMGPDGITAKPR
jgi:hypothetical protein